MTSPSALMGSVALLLFQNIREGIETGRIANMDTAQTEVEGAIAELTSNRLLEGPSPIDDIIGKLLLEIMSLNGKVAKCELQLAEFQARAEALKEETAQIVARTEACNLLVEQQQKENTEVLAAMEGMKADTSTVPPTFHVPAPSPTDPHLHPTPSRMAVVSFPGGPRTITIHPPNSPHYQSIIRDEKGDVVITLKGTKPLRREGAFRGPLEEIDWRAITRVCGCGPDVGGSRAVPPVPRWPDSSQPSPCPTRSRGPSDIISRQRQLARSMQTDACGRVLPPDYLADATSPSPPPGMSSSSEPSQELQSSSGAKPETVSTPASTPPSPSLGRGKKRTRHVEGDEDLTLVTETREGAPPLISPRGPVTPTLVEREGEFHLLEGPTKRRKRRSSTSGGAVSAESLSRSNSALDPTRTI